MISLCPKSSPCETLLIALKLDFARTVLPLLNLLGHVTSSTRQHACPAVPRQIAQSTLDEAELKSRPIFMGTRS
jgi:hypothetical protein